MDKLESERRGASSTLDVVSAGSVFDVASLILYGAQATPIRLKILLDRLFAVLPPDQVLQILTSFGWNYDDYARGYIAKVSRSLFSI